MITIDKKGIVISVQERERGTRYSSIDPANVRQASTNYAPEWLRQSMAEASVSRRHINVDLRNRSELCSSADSGLTLCSGEREEGRSASSPPSLYLTAKRRTYMADLLLPFAVSQYTSLSLTMA